MTEVSNEFDLNRDEAKSLTEAIQHGMHGIRSLILRAFRGRVWIALGYASWAAYCDGELAGGRLELEIEERREAVRDLTEAGMSSRAIGAALGVSHPTVIDDRATGGRNLPPGPVTGTDGKTYQRPAPAPAP